VLAVGGGPVSSIVRKVVAAAALYEGDAWDLVVDPKKIVDALPVVSVSHTGSDRNRDEWQVP